jgi:hypothetical protein
MSDSESLKNSNDDMNHECNQIIMYVIHHTNIQPINHNVIYFGVNEIYKKEKINLLEYELEIYNPFLQKRGYMETSAYLHVYWNQMYNDYDMIGFLQYDMIYKSNYNHLKKDTIYLLNSYQMIVKNEQWNDLMFSNIINLTFLIESYNQFFNKHYSMKELENMPLSLWQTNIYPISIYVKLCKWLELLVNEIYPWCNEDPYQTHFGSIGGYTERALSLFNAFEIYEGIEYENLDIQHYEPDIVKEQYNQHSFLNKYSQDIHTTFIENITGNYDVHFCMFKAQCYLNGIYYNCERINKHHKNGLYFIKDKEETYREHGFDIEGQDPRIFILNHEVYVIFICLSPYQHQNICIGLTKFDEWNPVFLQIENMEKNIIEKNWTPFVKDNQLYFVYNYDPLIILTYDFNSEGICKVVFKQDNISLPIHTSSTHLRGGSNLIHYKDQYYIGGCHSRIYSDCFEHYTHIILLDTMNWKLVYVSKPVMYLCDISTPLNAWHSCENTSKPLDRFHTIIVDKTPNIIQDPISLYMKDNEYYITINVRDCVSLLYKITFANLYDFIKMDKPLGYYDNYVKEMLINHK